VLKNKYNSNTQTEKVNNTCNRNKRRRRRKKKKKLKEIK
jgi:hypothetical protein